MKKLLVKFSGMVACLALMVTAMTANSTCTFWAHQPVMPEGAKRLRKF